MEADGVCSEGPDGSLSYDNTLLCLVHQGSSVMIPEVEAPRWLSHQLMRCSKLSIVALFSSFFARKGLCRNYG